MSDPFDDLLVHTCTITTQTATATRKPYGQPVPSPADATDVPCRFSRPRFSEMLDDTGQRQRVDGKLFVKFTASVNIGCTIKDIKGADGAAVATGTFQVVEVLTAGAQVAGHHKEVLVRRA